MFGKVGDNINNVNIPMHMCIYLMMKVENMTFYEPSMLDEDTSWESIISIEDLTLKA